MALSGLDIFKLLPKTNCGDCGVPTCMAFAMKLAQKKADLSQCPHASEEAKATLGASSEPPIRLVKIGGSKPLSVGNETVMFRHEKTFFHPPGLAVELRTSESRDRLLSKVKETENYKVERVGEELSADLFFVHHDSDHGQDLLTAIQSIKQTSSKGIILHCADREALKSGLELLETDAPAVFLAREVSDEDIALAKDHGARLILTADSLQGLAYQAEKVRESGLKDIILNLESADIGRPLSSGPRAHSMQQPKLLWPSVNTIP